MYFRRTNIAAVLVICLVLQITHCWALFGYGRSRSQNTNAGPRPVSPMRSKAAKLVPLAAGFAVGYGATYLAMQAIKRNNPCAFNNAGITQTAEMNSRISANERCTQTFTKYKGDLKKCPGVTGASCIEIAGDMKCAITLQDGTPIPIYDCA